MSCAQPSACVWLLASVCCDCVVSHVCGRTCVLTRNVEQCSLLHCNKLLSYHKEIEQKPTCEERTCVPAAPRGLKSLSPSSLATCSTSRYVLNSACVARWRGFTRSWLARKMPAGAVRRGRRGWITPCVQAATPQRTPAQCVEPRIFMICQSRRFNATIIWLMPLYVTAPCGTWLACDHVFLWTCWFTLF
jgi:hypothetical protein